jgi:hypothetical protein
MRERTDWGDLLSPEEQPDVRNSHPLGKRSTFFTCRTFNECLSQIDLMSEMTAPFCHPRKSVAGNYLIAVIPAVSGGYPSEGNPR